MTHYNAVPSDPDTTSYAGTRGYQLLSASEIQAWLIERVSQHSGLAHDQIDSTLPFTHYSFASRDSVILSGQLQAWLGRDISPTIMWEYPNIQLLAEHLANPSPVLETARGTDADRARISDLIAIIGVGCRFPGADDPDAFWELLANGQDATTEPPIDRSAGIASGKWTVRRGGFLEHVDQFDPQFFNISPREANLMDPQQRLLLEVAWEALERAGETPFKLAGSQTGVYVGISGSDYMRLQLAESSTTDAYTGTGNALSIAANRLSYFLDLRGPSLAVDTACSSSLVAVHLACQSLMLGEATLALAGGVNLILSSDLTDVFNQAGMLSPDGRCKTFAATADGYVRSEGCGIIVLKPLSAAIQDKNPIVGIIRGSAVNQDGRSNGITAPNGIAQQAVIRQALANAQVVPSQISYVETHGTGTPLGDPIEVQALAHVFQEGRYAENPCMIGSVKANIGHLEAAAGIAGLIKVLLCMQHGEFVPQPHLHAINPQIPLAKMPLSIPGERRVWAAEDQPRLASVSSFGFGGTNAHIVVQEGFVPPSLPVEFERPKHLLCLSAQSESALRRLAQRYADHLHRHPEHNLADICFTAHTARSHFPYRLAVTDESHHSLMGKLQAYSATGREAYIRTGQAQRRDKPRIAFLFTGQGAQYCDMGRQLYATEPLFRVTLDRCATILADYLDQPLLSVLYPDPTEEQRTLLDETEYTQPAMFAFEYALATLWRSWGIEPDAVFGHSVGEYVAACVAGNFSLEDGLALIAERARLMQLVRQSGQMAVVFASLPQVLSILRPYAEQVSVAAVNGPTTIVISGDATVVPVVLEHLENEGISTRLLRVSHAFHSPLMASVQDAFEHAARFMRFSTPHIPLIWDQTGRFLEPGQVPDASSWRQHITAPVQFATGIETLVAAGYNTFIEIGPQPTLITMGRRCAPSDTLTWLPSLKQGHDDWSLLLDSLGALYVRGGQVDWKSYDQSYQRRHVPLPTYPFERKRYWMVQSQPDAPHPSQSNIDPSVAATRRREPSDMIAQTPGHSAHSIPSAPSLPTARQEQILGHLREIVGQLTQIDPASIDPDMPFLEMGADSIVLVEAVNTFKKTFGIAITIRQLFENLTTLNALAAYIADSGGSIDVPAPEQVPLVQSAEASVPTLIARPAEQPVPALASSTADISGQATPLENILAQQLDTLSRVLNHQTRQQLETLSQVIAQQNEVLRAYGLSTTLRPSQGAPAAEPQRLDTVATAMVEPRTTVDDPSPPSVAHHETSKTDRAEVYIPYQPLRPTSMGSFTPRQQQHLEALIRRYEQRTPQSKRLTQAGRAVLADNRASAGFRFSIKEMLYPIIAERSQGSKIWDVDGNEYLDISMGFGVNLFGHSAEFIVRALEDQLQKGIHLGPQSNLASEVAQLIHELTGMERVTFCNSGTEAIMTALRLARTATGRNKIAIFAGSYHGTFDGVLARLEPGSSTPTTVPIAPGIPQRIADDILVLDYGQPSAIERIQAHAHELAAVLVEPVQSRRPDLQPEAFLRQIRQLTEQAGIALIFDEVITGFRIHQGGAQAWLGIRADIATYGKIVGGGMPIGVVAGRPQYLNGIDGGMWQYGDSSYPQAETTFFAGTFCKHPLAMATAWAVLQHMKDQGPALQEQLNQRTATFAARMNTYFAEAHVPIQIVYFGSLFRFAFAGNMDLLFYHLQEKGVYIWEGRNCFLSTAHTDADIDHLVEAIKASIVELQNGGFLPEPPTRPSSNGNPSIGDTSTDSHSTLGKDQEPVLSAPDHIVDGGASVVAQFPLTDAQKQLWFLAQLDAHVSVAYHNYLILELGGTLQMPVLQQVFDQIVSRHQALRTSFSADGTLQQVWSKVEQPIVVTDGSDTPAGGVKARIEQWLVEIGQQAFDLAQGVLFRAHLLAIQPARHILAVIIHQSIADGWSINLILQELGALYSAACTQQPLSLKIPLQYQDYVNYIIQEQDSPAMAAAEAYWLKHFSGTLPVLELPTDKPRPPIQTYTGAQQRLTVDPELVTKLKRISAQQSSTLFMTVLAVFKVFLHRMTGQDDLVVGIPSAGRALEGADQLVGNCTNILALRTQITADPSFSAYLNLVKGVFLDAHEHQIYPFPKLVQKVNPPRDPSRFPIVSVLFNMDRALSLPPFADLHVGLGRYPISYTDVDLNVNITQYQEQLLIDIAYKTDLFEASTIERYVGYFHMILQSIAENPVVRLSAIPLLPPSERHQLLTEWNATQKSYPDHLAVHQLFEMQAAQQPDSIAIVFEDQQMSYQMLNQRADTLARTLRQLGVQAETRIGLCVQRSVEMLIGMLAVLKADGAYVPLDPSYPKDRLAFVMADAQIGVLLTQTDLVAELPTHQAHVICIDAHSSPASTQHEPIVSTGISPEQLAYVIYTSGSTGKPKGVQISHRALSNFLHALREQLGIAAHDVLLAVTTLSFDIAGLELFLPLIAGARVVIATRTTASDGLALAEQIAASGATIMQATPATWHLLLAAGWRGHDHLTILCGGEALSRELADQLLMRSVALWNMYGPTETTIWSTMSRVKHGATPVMIGRPIANTDVYLLDQALRPVPRGSIGEIYIGGRGLARGYMNRPDLTADRFVPHPFTHEPGERLYKTGDIARYLPTGEIEGLGRIDHQIKLRGFRIELGEIEAVLRQHPEVREGVVIVRADTPGQQTLVAYVVPEQGSMPATDALRSFLKLHLPEYMVPTTFVSLPELPLTLNNKIDRRALPAPSGDRPELTTACIEPRNALEEAVAHIWKELLNLERIGVYDNFFDLGGHSLMITQMLSRLNKIFRVTLPVHSLFMATTIAAITDLLTRHESKPGQAFQIAQTLQKIRNMSAAEVQQTLVQKKPQRGGA